MDVIAKPIKFGLIASMVILITILHYFTLHGELRLHILHRELYFLPILLASFWFGLNLGLVTSLTVSFIYAPYAFVSNETQSNLLPVVFQILVFNLVAFVLGWLVDHKRNQQEQLVRAEKLAVLGRAAVAIGHEMKDLLAAVKRIAMKADEQKCVGLDQDFQQEVSRLEQMVEILSSFITTKPLQLFSQDMNEVIRETLEQYNKTAGKLGVNLAARLDEGGCPSRVDKKAIGWVLERIIRNALEVSRKGQTIHVRSRRSGSFCTVEIEDQGPGIKPEHLPSIFKPFFTTKEMGQGLALAACQKTLRDMGGDIQVASVLGKGACFTVTIPREYSGKPLAVDPVAAVIRGEQVERIYRE